MKKAGGVALAGLLPSIERAAAHPEAKGAIDRPSRIAVFYEPGFPEGELGSLTEESLRRAFGAFNAGFFDLEAITTRLERAAPDLLVLPYGSKIPREAFEPFLRYLKSGGSWLNIGGVPMATPVVREGRGWRTEDSRTSLHKRLGITQAFPVSGSEISSFAVNDRFENAHEIPDSIRVRETYELYVRLTSTMEYPDEAGSAGPREAVLHPVVSGLSSSGLKIAAPVVCIDRRSGEFAGGRWVLANFSGKISPKALRALASIALQPPADFEVHPSFACYREGEVPEFSVQLRSPHRAAKDVFEKEVRYDLRDEKDKRIADGELALTVKATGLTCASGLARKTASRLAPGLYRLSVHARTRKRGPLAPQRLTFSSGFWMFDEKLLASGSPLAVGETYFVRDGKPFPVTGTTYMASDTHRKFLLEPNPAVWNTDMQAIREAGVNMVRTGIWTGWKGIMPATGMMSEAVLRAADAFFLTARKHDLPVIFTFFAFLPGLWGGENAYLDPRAVSAQKDFILAFVRRYARAGSIAWDLINEPSFCSPAHLWACRPNGDRYERDAWSTWLSGRYAGTTADERLARVEETYRAAPGEPPSLPGDDEFADDNIFNDHRPVKVIDYRLFAQEMFRKWAAEMTSTIHASTPVPQLVTIGQDEAGLADSPCPHFFAPAADFTSIHDWWSNDDLLWDSIVSAVPGKANLVEETGVMFYETMAGKPWRTEQEVANLLERKLAIAIGSGNAGYIEWVWNTNPYMPSDNEAAIGMLRPDGTAKPEFETFVRMSKFVNQIRDVFTGRAPEDVVMLIPHSNMFSTRNFATGATRRCVRTMYYHCRTPMAAVSEYDPERMPASARLIVVPSPRVLTRRAWDALKNAAFAGATVLISGPCEADEHWLPAPRLTEFGLRTSTHAVAETEFAVIEGRTYAVRFGGEKMQRIEKGLVEGKQVSEISTLPQGAGKILWMPLPVESGDDPEVVAALYTFALRQAAVPPVFEVAGNDPAVLILPGIFSDAALYTFVSESGRDSGFAVRHLESGMEFNVQLPAQRAGFFVVRRKTGEVLSRLYC